MLLKPLELSLTPRPSVGILGIVVESDMIYDILIAAIESSLPKSEQVAYLLDDGGYIVGRSFDYPEEDRNDSIDEFLGNEHPGLFQDLVKREVFVERSVVGYNMRTCEDNLGGEQISNSAQSMFTVSHAWK